ncbi:PAS domain-containing protein, partial [Marinomonas atlantica]
EQKRIFLLILGAAIATLIIGTVYIVRINNSALEMKEEVHLLSEVVENNPTVIIITNREGQIQYVNNSFEAISGYKKDEVLGQTSRMFKSGEMSEQEYAAMSRTLNTGNSWHGELQSKRKDGRFYWERASISPLINDH